jgi:transposase
MMTDQGLSVAEVARRLGVGENCLRDWRAAAREQGDAAFPGQGNPSPADEELRRLRAEVQRLRAERDLLKKAAAYFASPPS